MLRRAVGMAHRFQEGKTFHAYVTERIPLLVGVLLVFVVLGAACAAAVVVLAASASRWLVLFAFILAPAVLLIVFFVQAHAFLAWIEDRALARSLGHKQDLRRSAQTVAGALDLPVAALALGVPVALLAIASPGAAAVLVLAAAAAPFLYAAIDS